MPYITEYDRALVDNAWPATAGELNYAITKLINVYLSKQTLNYQVINDVMGALTGAQAEFYRRVAVPYENSKLALNGDVYERRESLDRADGDQK